jgi:hypothetical protein
LKDTRRRPREQVQAVLRPGCERGGALPLALTQSRE